METLRRRISRSIITVIFLSLLNVIGAPILAPQYGSNSALAANSNIIQTGLTLNANATAGSNDVPSVMTFGTVAPTNTNSGVGYYTFDATTNKYIYANRDFADSGPVSIFAWIYPTAAGVIMNHTGQGDAYTGYRLSLMDYTAAGKFRVGLYTSTGAQFVTSTNVTTPLNNWYYVGLTYDGSTLRGYINGQEFGTLGSVAWLTAASDYFNVGALQAGTCFGPCSGLSSSAASFRFAELSIYVTNLTAANVVSNYNGTQTRFAPFGSNPAAASIIVNRSATFTSSCSSTTSNNGATACGYQWQLSTDSGVNWVDISGATSGTYTTSVFSSPVTGYQYRVRIYDPGMGSPTSAMLFSNSAAASLTITQPPVSDTDTALSFNGTSQYAVASGSTIVPTAPSSPFTIESWVYPTAAGQDSNIYSQGSGSNRFYYKRASGNLIFLRDGFGLPEQNCGAFPSNAWTHIAISWDGSSQFKCYLNSNLTLTTSVSSISTTLNGPSAMGQHTGNLSASNGFFPGQIDEVKIWSSVRTASEISSDMHSRAAASTTNLLAYYDFNEGTGTTLYNRVLAASSSSDFTLEGSPSWDGTRILKTATFDAYTVNTFYRTYITVNDGFKMPATVSRASVLVVAGGGGGGSRHGGGGGAGGLAFGGNYPVSPSTSYSIVVGTGGVGYGRPGNDAYKSGTSFVDYLTSPGGGIGSVGSNSLFKLASSNADSITALGGGGGSGSGAAGAGGSGGGSNQNVTAGTTIQFSGPNWIGYGNPGGRGASGSCSTDWCGGGGGGAGTAGQDGNLSSSGRAGNGGAGRAYSFESAVLTYYAGGGGGASLNGNANGGLGGDGGGGNGGRSAAGTSGSPSTGGGGGGGGFGGGFDYAGGNGGSGVVMVRWITATKPTYTKPVNAFLNAGMTETFTTNVAQDSATVGLTRTFRWESTTTGAAGTFSLIKQGTGAANAVFSWVPTDTSTSGSNYLYRLIVTDSDTAGLFITDSSTAFAIINRALSVTGSSRINKAINVSRSETFTITLGTSTYRSTLLPVIPGITLDTSTAGSAIIRIADTATVGTYYETLTVTDSVSASVVIPLTINVTAPPTLLNTGEIVANDLVFHLDAGNSASLIGESGTATTGITWKDLSGSKVVASTGVGVNTGAFSNATCTAPTYTSANGGALNFTASSDNCYYASALSGRTLVNSYTVESWFKTSATLPANTAIVSQATSASSVPIYIFIQANISGNLIVGFYDQATTANRFANCPYTPTIGVWTHIAGTYDGTTLTTYINGTSNSCTLTQSYTPTGNANTLGMIIGKGQTGATNTTFPGSIATVRMYSKSLTAAQILSNFNATKFRFDPSNDTSITPIKKYGDNLVETFTVTSGSDTRTVSFATGNRSGIAWDTTTVNNQVRLTIQESLAVGTFTDTVTVSDALGQSTYLPFNMTVSKADSLTVTMSAATVNVYNGSAITFYPRPTVTGLKSSDTATSVSRFSSSLYLESTAAPINADTYTVRGNTPTFTLGSLNNYLGVIYETSTARINKAVQRPLNIYMYGGVVGSSYLISLQGGGGTGLVSETLTGVSNLSGCAINNRYLTATEQKQGFCEVRVVKAGDQNYFAETQTVQMYFMAYLNNQPTGLTGSGATIALNGATSITYDSNVAPIITSLSSYSASAGSTQILINGAGFNQADIASITVKFWRNVVASGFTINGGNSQITVTVPVGATTGKVTVTTPNGIAVSELPLTITP